MATILIFSITLTKTDEKIMTLQEAIANPISFSTSGEKISQLKKRSPMRRIPIKVMKKSKSVAKEAVMFSIFLLSIQCIIIHTWQRTNTIQFIHL